MEEAKGGLVGHIQATKTNPPMTFVGADGGGLARRVWVWWFPPVAPTHSPSPSPAKVQHSAEATHVARCSTIAHTLDVLLFSNKQRLALNGSALSTVVGSLSK